MSKSNSYKVKTAMTAKWQNGDDLSQFYSDWSEYEEELAPAGYKGPHMCAQIVDKYFDGDKSTAQVLDVAAGTGFVGQELKLKGFNIIDGLEPSTGMAEQAMGKNVYRNMYHEYFNDDVKCLKTDSYDILVMVGALGEGHFPVNGLPEMIRIVKPGGLVVIVGRRDFLTTIEAYNNKLVPAMDNHARDGKWQKLEQSFVPNYYHEHDAIVFVFKIN